MKINQNKLYTNIERDYIWCSRTNRYVCIFCKFVYDTRSFNAGIISVLSGDISFGKEL